MSAAPLVLAKAPHPGRVKTRLGATVGPQAAAELAALALLDTIDACRAFSDTCYLALSGELAGAVGEAELRSALRGWRVFEQRGDGLAQRIGHAHRYTGERVDGPVLQIGMDTPQVRPDDFAAAAAALERHPAVLGPAEDGGWWLLGLRDPHHAAHVRDVPMSHPQTAALTASALRAAGLQIECIGSMCDVDTAHDAAAVSAAAPSTRFSRRWRELTASSAQDAVSLDGRSAR